MDTTNLAEQLRAHIDTLKALRESTSPSRRVAYKAAQGEQTEALLTVAADTIAAQASIIVQAETLAGAVDAWRPGLGETVLAYEQDVLDSRQAFRAAQAEYATHGTVPCGECEALKSQLEGPAECFECGSAIQGYCPHCAPIRLEAENAALVEAIREALQPVLTECSCGYTIRDAEAIDRTLESALSQPHPGATFLERMAALERENEALRKEVERLRPSCPDCRFDLDGRKCMKCANADRALDAIRNREGR